MDPSNRAFQDYSQGTAASTSVPAGLHGQIVLVLESAKPAVDRLDRLESRCCAVGVGIVPLCPGLGGAGREASRTGEVCVASTLSSAATALAGLNPASRQKSMGSRRRTRPPAYSDSPRPPYSTTTPPWTARGGHLCPHSPMRPRDRQRVARPPARLRLVFSLPRLTTPPSAQWCHHEVSFRPARAVNCLPKCLDR